MFYYNIPSMQLKKVQVLDICLEHEPFAFGPVLFAYYMLKKLSSWIQELLNRVL